MRKYGHSRIHTHRGTKFAFLTGGTHEMNARDKISSGQDELIDNIEIKHEEVDFPHNYASHSDFEGNFSLPTVQNILHVDCGGGGPDKVEENDLDNFYLDIFQSDRCCEICQKYMKMLSRHVRSAHAPPQSQSVEDPLHIDPPELHELQQTSSIQIKSEIVDCIDEKVEMYYSEEESESKNVTDPELEYDGESDPDYSPSTSVTRSENSRHQRHLARNNNNASSEPTTSKTKNVTHTSPQNFKCSKCDQSFKFLIHLKTHMRGHTGPPKPIKCEECEMSFTYRSTFTEHRRIHTGERPYACDACAKIFRRMSDLNVHKRVHTGERPYKCDQCGKSFTRSCHLTEHKRHHKGEKPYECTVCEKRFTARSNLNAHIKGHTGEKPHKCDKCERSFIRSRELMRHGKVHNGDKSFGI